MPLLSGTGWSGGLCLLIAAVCLVYGTVLLFSKKGSAAIYGMLSMLPATTGMFFGFLNLTFQLKELADILSPNFHGFWEADAVAEHVAGEMYVGFLGAALTGVLLLYGLVIISVRSWRQKVQPSHAGDGDTRAR